MHRSGRILVWIFLGIALAGCPHKKGSQDFKAAEKALDLKDYDAAVDYYSKALQAEPNNAAYRIKLNQSRFEAGQFHIHQGVKLRDKGDIQGAISEFQRATILDPSSIVADQELKKSLDALAERTRASQQQEEQPMMENGQPALAAAPPELKPLSRAPINLKMSNDSKIIFDTIGKLGGLTVIYDPDLQARRITTELNNVTLEQALDIVCLESKTFWKPITENIIMVIPDQTQKRRDYDEQVVRTFYLNNIAVAQDLTEVTTGLRQLLDLKRIQQVNAQSAIIVRDTPDKLALIDKIVKDIDKAKPEVIVQVEVLEARTDHLRNLGILPPQSTSVTINPNSSTSNNSGSSTTTTNNGITLTQLTHLNQNDVVFTIPSATANFLMTDSATKIIENPEIRAIDGQAAKLRIGDRVPVATGSYQAGVGVGSTAGAGFVNPLVNTQFQYIDVGVNIDVTPHVHPNRDVSMKLLVEVSSVTGYQNIGGIQQPIISQRKIEHEIRLKENEVSILGGLIDRIDTKTLNGWPWLAKIPVMRYLFSTENVERQDNEDIIVLIPHIVRMPEWTKANLRSLYAGTDTNPTVKRELDVKSPSSNPGGSANLPSSEGPQAPGTIPATPTSGPVVANPGTVSPPPGAAAVAPPQVSGPRIRFEPDALNLRAGQTATLGIVVENVSDLYSVPMMLQYNPAVLSVEEVRHGGFLSGGTQEIAIVQRVDKEHGQAIISATRQPNTPGVSGSGTLLGVVVKALAPGNSSLSVVQINAKDSQQRPIPLVTSEASLKVQ
jgi:general secretion pathway protein D